MNTVIYCFRNDLRLNDNPALGFACQSAGRLLPVVCIPDDEPGHWISSRMGNHRRAFRWQAIKALDAQLQRAGSRLLVLRGRIERVLPIVAAQIGASHIICEDVAGPYEQREIQTLREAGLTVDCVWQSTMLHPDDLPFDVAHLPSVFTEFRHKIEQHAIAVRPSVVVPVIPSWPDTDTVWLVQRLLRCDDDVPLAADDRSGFPYWLTEFEGASLAGEQFVRQYLRRGLPHTYKTTRDQLIGTDYSTHWSPWLACGALSPRWIYHQLQAFEAVSGASESSYWLWFELLWRDYFRFLHVAHGEALYRPEGLSHLPVPVHDPAVFDTWCQGKTGQPLVDAAMRELMITGFLSNRLRQVVASYFIHDLHGDWRAGAEWFEHCLIDYDMYSNQGNWLYIAGRGTDPRGGRRFNLAKQACQYDPDGVYVRLWETV